MPKVYQRRLLLEGIPRPEFDEIEQLRFNRLSQLLKVMGRGRWGVRRIRPWMNKVSLAIYNKKDVVRMLESDGRFFKTGNGWRCS